MDESGAGSTGETFNMTPATRSQKVGLLIDTGAHDNLGGMDSLWFKEHMKELERLNTKPTVRTIPEIAVSGVGSGAARTSQAFTFPGAAVDSEGVAQKLVFDTPMVAGSPIPPLFGFRSLSEKRAIIECAGRKIHFVGQGDVKIILPPGSQTFPFEVSEGGHPILPVGEFDLLQRQARDSKAIGERKVLTFNLQTDEIPSSTSDSKAMIDSGTQHDGDESDILWRREHLCSQPASSP